jgi:RNA polymerase sigma-70 factor, ECF subfamily
MASVSDDHRATSTVAATFEQVYRRHFGFVWRTLNRMRVRDADLLDLAQNVFIIVHRQLPRFEGRSELSTWLYSICKLVARDYLRSALIRREVLVDEREVAQRGALNDGMMHRLHSRDLSQLLPLILDKIPEKLREVFVLFELDELSGEEIARLLNIPLGTVRSRLRLARAAFQVQVRLLSEEEPKAVLAPAWGLLDRYEVSPDGVRPDTDPPRRAPLRRAPAARALSIK